jgi:putative phosphoribosyl transferase
METWLRAHEHPVSRREVAIRADHVVALPGFLAVPSDAVGIVVFAHGSGSSRSSPRNLRVAAALNDVCLGTLLFDLLTPSEALDRRNVFDVPLLADRLALASSWLEVQAETRHVPVGYFGASTGAAAALWAAADRAGEVGAVVSRGGRPDLAEPRLGEVEAPTMLIVGGLDDVVLRLNRLALERLDCEAELRVVPRAGHLFEEPGALERVSALAAGWFRRHLGSRPSEPAGRGHGVGRAHR